MQGPVELPVTATVVRCRLVPGGRKDRCDTGEGGGEGRLGAEPARMRPADQDLSCGDRSKARQVEEARATAYQRENLILEALGLGLQALDALGCGPPGPGGPPALHAVCRAIPKLSTPDDLSQRLSFRNSDRRSSGADTIKPLS